MPSPEPEMNEPENQPPDEGAGTPAPPSRSRPDWLVGAEEGVASEWSRSSGTASEFAPVKLRLVKPEQDAPPAGQPSATGGDPPAARRLPLMGPEENIGLTRPAGMPLPKPEAARKTAWTAAASSVPTIKRTAPVLPAPQFTRPHDEPAEETEGEDATPAFDVSEPRIARPAPVTLAPLRESWWVVAVDEVTHNAKIQLAIGVAVLAILAYLFWPRGESGVSVARLRHHPELYDNHVVRVHGTIGDVYAIAGGYTFYLLQGGDTLVVFTRTRVPIPQESVSIRGTISTGYLDGVPRQALFEQ
jgi:hypothetical protein